VKNDKNNKEDRKHEIKKKCFYLQVFDNILKYYQKEDFVMALTFQTVIHLITGKKIFLIII